MRSRGAEGMDLAACGLARGRRDTSHGLTPILNCGSQAFTRLWRLTLFLRYGSQAFTRLRRASHPRFRWLRFAALCRSSTFTRLRRASHFSLRGQRKVTKRKATPTFAPDGLLSVRSPAVLTVNRPANNSAIPGLRQFAFPRLPAPLLGAPVGAPFQAKARASCAQKRAARRNGVSRSYKRKMIQAHDLTPPITAFPPRLWRAGCAFNGAPMARRVGGEKARRVGARDRAQFDASPGMDCQRTPEPAREVGGQDARRPRHRGGLLFGYFLLATQEKVTRSPKASESLRSTHRKWTHPTNANVTRSPQASESTRWTSCRDTRPTHLEVTRPQQTDVNPKSTHRQEKPRTTRSAVCTTRF